MEAVLGVHARPKKTIKYSAMTVKALFYMGENEPPSPHLAHPPKEGVEQPLYALESAGKAKGAHRSPRRQRPGTGADGNPRVSRRRPRDDLLNKLTQRPNRPRTQEPLRHPRVLRNAQQTEAIHRHSETRRTLGRSSVGTSGKAIRGLQSERAASLASAHVVQRLRQRQLTLPQRQDARARRAHDHY